MANIDIVIFSCSGREQLLYRTLKTIHSDLLTSEKRIVLSIDGPFEMRSIESFPIHLVVQSRSRLGYIASICRALALVQTQHFLWLEDDWDLSCIRQQHLHEASSLLDTRMEFVQVRWPKDERTNGASLTEAIRVSTAGFSANPNFARTSAMLALFGELQNARAAGKSLPANLGFETFCTDTMSRLQLHSATFDFTRTGTVQHLGEFESTDRKWHYVGQHQYSETAAINRVSLLPRFLYSAARVAATIPFSRRMSEIAFRFVHLLRSDRL